MKTTINEKDEENESSDDQEEQKVENIRSKRIIDDSDDDYNMDRYFEKVEENEQMSIVKIEEPSL